MLLYNWFILFIIKTMGKDNFINTKKSTPVWAIIFLLSVLVLTLGLYFYNSSLEKGISKIQVEISDSKSQIAILESNPEMQVYWLIKANKKTLEAFEKNNKITQYISHLKEIGIKYKVNFEWFNFSDWVLKTNAIIESNNESIAYNLTKDFIKWYREDPKALFDLGFIKSFKWMDSIKFSVSMNIK